MSLFDNIDGYLNALFGGNGSPDPMTGMPMATGRPPSPMGGDPMNPAGMPGMPGGPSGPPVDRPVPQMPPGMSGDPHNPAGISGLPGGPSGPGMYPPPGPSTRGSMPDPMSGAPMPGGPPDSTMSGSPFNPAGVPGMAGGPSGVPMPPPGEVGGDPGAAAAGPMPVQPNGPGGIGSDAARTPGTPQPPWTPASALPQPKGPLNITPNGAPLNIGPNGPNAAPPRFAPVNVQPPGAPGFQPNAFGRALGVTSADQAGKMGREFFGGLGGGLKAAAANWNKPGAAAFAAGAGGAIESSEHQQKQQFGQDLQTRQQAWHESNDAFKNVLASAREQNETKYRDAQAKYLAARGQYYLNGGGGGRGLLGNTPYGQMMGIEGLAQRLRESERKTMEKGWAVNNSTPEEQAKDKAALEQKIEAFRQQRYSQLGLDPKEIERVKSLGTTQKTPFTPKDFGDSQEGFDAHVPMGAFYVGEDGKTYRRTKAPTSMSAPGPQASTESYGDVVADQTAMTPAA